MINTLIIKPVSTFCNLGCDYCYHNSCGQIMQSKKIHRMDSEILEKMVVEFSKAHQINSRFLWHGGEPMLAGLNFFREVVFFQKKYFSNGHHYTNSIQSNGTIMSKNLRSFLKEENFSIGISLDGPEYIHNRHRKDKQNRGSFQKTMRTLTYLMEENISVGIVCVVTKESVGCPKELLDFFVKNNLFKINFSPVADLMSNNTLTNYSITPEEWGKFLLGLFDVWVCSNDKRIRIRLFDELLRMYYGEKPKLCLLNRNCSEFLSVDYNGDVYICGRFLKNAGFCVGNIMENSFQEILSSERYVTAKAKIESLSVVCIHCGWSNICNGGCASYRFMDGVGQNHPYFCESMKIILPHIEDVLGRYGFQKSQMWSSGGYLANQ